MTDQRVPVVTSCRSCQVEWVAVSVRCWLCGSDGERGKISQWTPGAHRPERPSNPVYSPSYHRRVS